MFPYHTARDEVINRAQKIMMGSKKGSAPSAKTSRRRFTRAVATTIVAAPLASRFAEAQNTKKEPVAPPNPQPATTTAQKPSPLADAYVEVVRARFPDRLTPEEIEQVRKDLESNLQAADRLRAVKLKNEDEPDFTFTAE